MTFSRRGFLKRTLGACWTGATLLEQSLLRATQARAQAVGPQPTLFTLQKVADGIYAAVAKPQVVLNCNAVVFENANDLLVVDSHSKPSAVHALLAQIRREITPKPVKYLVNSHFHWDHTQGTAAYRRLTPDAHVLASEATRRLLDENASLRLAASLDEVRKALEEHRNRLGAARTADEKAYRQQAVEQSERYLREMREFRPELPNLTFERDLILHDKAHDLHLAFRGRGHTAGDVVVHCPQKGVVATGDLLHGFGPWIGDGFPRDWPTTLYRVAELPFTQIVGGHGAVMPGRDRLFQHAAYLEELTDLVERGRLRGESVERLQERITPATVPSLQRGGYGQWIAETLQRGSVVEPGATLESLLAGTLRQNIAQTASALERS